MRRLFKLVQRCAQILFGAVQQRKHLLGPLVRIRLAGGSRLEVCIIGWRGQQRVHLAQPFSDGAGHDGVAFQGFLELLGRAANQQGIGQRALQVVQRPAPGIALIGDVAVRDRQRVHDALRVDALHLAQQRWNVPVAGPRQVAGHLGFGRQARLHAADQLQDDGIAHDDRAVGLFARQPVHVEVAVEIHAGQPRLGQKADHARLVARLAAAASVEFRARLHRAERAAHEARLQEGVGQDAHFGAAAHTGDGVLDDGGLVPDQDKGRLRAHARRTVLRLDLGPIEFPVGRGERRGVGQTCAGRRRRPRIPALARQILRQDLALQRGAGRVGQRRAAPVLEHQGNQFGHLGGRRRVPSGRRGVLTQVHPVKAVGRQRQ